jgi:hypothetical protein
VPGHVLTPIATDTARGWILLPEGGPELAETLALTCHVAKIARALTRHRALQAAREDGEAVDPDWASAPLETLAMVLDESYLGG